MSNAIALLPVDQIERMATAIAQSGLFGAKTVDQALALMLIAQAEGKHPATAAQEYHIINGRPALKADAMLARFQASGGSVKWNETSDARADATFTHPQGGSITVDWDIKRAQMAGVTGNPTWKKYPRAMLRARVISEGVRACFPGATGGFYVPEEVQDFGPAAQPQRAKNADAVDVQPLPPADPWDPILQGEAGDAANKGLAAYQAWWKAQPVIFRDAAVATPQHAAFKDCATAVDAGVAA